MLSIVRKWFYFLGPFQDSWSWNNCLTLVWRKYIAYFFSKTFYLNEHLRIKFLFRSILTNRFALLYILDIFYAFLLYFIAFSRTLCHILSDILANLWKPLAFILVVMAVYLVILGLAIRRPDTYIWDVFEALHKECIGGHGFSFRSICKSCGRMALHKHFPSMAMANIFLGPLFCAPRYLSALHRSNCISFHWIQPTLILN